MTKLQRLRHNWFQFLLAIDQLANTIIGMLFFWCGYEAYADETLSAESWRKRDDPIWWVIMNCINGLFFNRNHCKEAYESEQKRSQLPTAYRLLD